MYGCLTGNVSLQVHEEKLFLILKEETYFFVQKYNFKLDISLSVYHNFSFLGYVMSSDFLVHLHYIDGFYMCNNVNCMLGHESFALNFTSNFSLNDLI